MKKYFLILFCSFAFGQASNQMVTFLQAQSLGFDLKPGQYSVASNECMTKSQAQSKYNLDINAMSAYADNQLVPRSVWFTGADITPPSYLSASLVYVSSTNSSLTGSWSGWYDSVGISFYRIVVTNYTTGIVEHTSPNLSYLTNSYTATGLSGGTLYYYGCRAFDAAGNWAELVFPYTTPPSNTYTQLWGYYQDPCGVQFNNLYQSNGLYYTFDGSNYNLYSGLLYVFNGPSLDVYDWYDWSSYYIDNGVETSSTIIISPCGGY